MIPALSIVKWAVITILCCIGRENPNAYVAVYTYLYVCVSVCVNYCLILSFKPSIKSG